MRKEVVKRELSTFKVIQLPPGTASGAVTMDGRIVHGQKTDSWVDEAGVRKIDQWKDINVFPRLIRRSPDDLESGEV
jgi:hypothetical protein